MFPNLRSLIIHATLCSASSPGAPAPLEEGEKTGSRELNGKGTNKVFSQNEMMWTAGIQMKWVCDHRSESQFKQLRKSPKKRDFGASTGFEPMASALALQCSTSLSYEDPYTGGRPIYWAHQPVKGMKHRMKWCELREYNCLNCDSLHSSVWVFIAQAGRALQR